MIAAVVGLVVAIVALVAAAATITTLALRAAGLQVKLGAETVARAAAERRAERADADMADYRRRAGVELDTLRAELEAMSREPHVVDPVVRRARWDRLLGAVAGAFDVLERTPEAAAGDVLPGLDGHQPGTAPAGGGAAGPGPGRPAP